MLIDTHAHLNSIDYQYDIENVIQRAYNNGIHKMIVVGMNNITNQKAIDLSLKFMGIQPSLGIHPCYYQNEDLEQLKNKVVNSQIVAIGETGLDLYHRQDNLPQQKYFFQAHIELALEYNLPLIIHAREACNEVYEILMKYKGKLKGVFHCLVSDLVFARKVIDLGFYIGIGGMVTYEEATQVQQIAQNIPLDHILLETDAPYLAPFPFRNQRNESANIKIIAEKIANLRNISMTKLAQNTTLNAEKLFGI